MPTDPACLDVGVEFGKPGEGDIKASLCEFSFTLPSFPIPPVFVLPPIPFPPPLPIPKISFSLSCDPNKPIDISAGIAWGGGKIPCVLPDPDQEAA